MDSIYPGSIWSTARPEDVGMDSGEREFYTLPESPEAYGFLALGDVHSLPDVWHKVSQRIYENESDALFIVGSGDDPADGNQYDQWIDQFFSSARDLLGRVPFWPAIGNHERTRQFVTVPPTAEQAERSHYFSLFELPGNEHWYRVDDQYLTLLIIDSNSQRPPGFEQYDWLHEPLRSSRNRYTVAYVVTGGGALYQINSAENRYQQVAKSTNHYLASDMTTAKMDVTAMDAEGEIIDQFVVPVGRATRGRMNSGWSQQLMGFLWTSR